VDPSLVRRLHRTLHEIAFRDPLEVADLAIDGDDLRQAGVSAGPALGRLLQRLLELVLADPTINHRDVLLAHARRMLNEDGAPT